MIGRPPISSPVSTRGENEGRDDITLTGKQGALIEKILWVTDQHFGHIIDGLHRLTGAPIGVAVDWVFGAHGN